MSDDCQFWLTWVVNLLIAVGTIGAVFVALFGERLKSKFFPPVLHLELLNVQGVRTPAQFTWVENNEAKQRMGWARYYHLRVTNESRWPMATEVQIYIVSVEQKGPNGQFLPTWTGELPLGWALSTDQATPRKVGRPATCDFCSIAEDKWIQFHPTVLPMGFKSRINKEDPERDRDLIVTVQAIAMEGSSKKLRLRMSWDGNWEVGDVEMQNHFQIAALAEN